MQRDPHDQQIWVKTSKAQKAMLEELARERLCSVADVIRWGLSDYLRRQPRIYEAAPPQDR